MGFGVVTVSALLWSSLNGRALKVQHGPSGAGDNHAWAILLSVQPPHETLVSPQRPRNLWISSNQSPREPWPPPFCSTECWEIYGIRECESQRDCKRQLWGFIEAVDQRGGQGSVSHTVTYNALDYITDQSLCTELQSEWVWTGEITEVTKSILTLTKFCHMNHRFCKIITDNVNVTTVN